MTTNTKQIGLAEAVAMILDGSTVWAGGWTVVRRPMAWYMRLFASVKEACIWLPIPVVRK